MNKLGGWLGLAMGLMLCTQAAAAGTDGEPFYAGGGLLYEFPDGARDSDNGIGGYLNLGMPLASRPGESLELSLFTLERDRDAGGSDAQTGLYLSWLKDFGLYGWDQQEGIESWLPAFTPFVLAGLGAVQEDTGDGDRIVPGLDLGVGALFPIPFRNWAVRTEALVKGQVNDESVPGEDYLIDYQLRVGLQIPLGFEPAEPEHADTPPADCGVAVVDPVTGRSDCTVDSDRDGVGDTADLCPGTPQGTPVDVNGCSAAEIADGDGDGVADDADDCQGTAAGVAVDEKGCVAPGTTVVLDNVRFAKNSADLTAEAKGILDQAAAQLGSQTEIVVEVAGHTDNEGKGNYNLMLSLLRAENVRQYLVGKGISRYRLFVEGYGETRPVASNDTEEGRAQNRRVDLDELDVKVVPR